MEKILRRASALHAVQRRKPWHLSASSCFCYSSPIYLTASPVLYSRVSMAFFLWYLLFGCPCPCLGAQPSGNVSTRELSREVPTQPSWHNQGWILYIHWTMQLHAYIQMERLAFPRVHWRVQACGDERGTREERERLSRRGQNADEERSFRTEGGGRERERDMLL